MRIQDTLWGDSGGLIQAGDNVWIQKNVQGDKSDLVTNISGNIKTINGDLIIRTKNFNNVINGDGIHKYFKQRRPENDENLVQGNIESGKSLYIYSDELINDTSKIKAKSDLILTGQKLDQPWDEKYKIKFGSITAGNNLVADFKDSINIGSNNLKANEKVSVSGENVLLQANHINLFNKAEAKNDLTLAANESINLPSKLDLKTKNSISIIAKGIDLYGSKLSSNNISIISPNDINLYWSKLSGHNLNLISKEGNIRTYTNTQGDSASRINELYATDDLTISAGKNIYIENTKFAKGQNVSFIANKNITVETNDNIFKNNPLQHNVRDLLLESGGQLDTYNSVSMTSGNDIILNGVRFNCEFGFSQETGSSCNTTPLASNHSINLQAGRDIKIGYRKIAEQYRKYIEWGKYAELATRIKSGDLIMNAGRNLELEAAIALPKGNAALFAGNTLLLPAYFFTVHDKKNTVHARNRVYIEGDKNITLTSNGEIITQASILSAKGGHLTINALGNVKLDSAPHVEISKNGAFEFERRLHSGSELSAKGLLTIISNGSLLFRATKLMVNGLGNSWEPASKIDSRLKDAMRIGTMDIAAKGGYLYAEAPEESAYYQVTNTGRNFWGRKKEYKDTHRHTTSKITEFTSTGDINILSRDDSTYEASKINAGRNAKLTSTHGSVNFKAIKNSEFHQETSLSKGFFIKQSDKGYTADTWVLPRIYTGGTLTIDSAKGVNADIKVANTQDLQNAIDILGNMPGTAWIKDLNKRDDVQWNIVKDAYDDWDYSSQRLSPLGASLIAIVVTAVTAGKGAPFAAKIAGGSAVAQGAITAGMSALASQAAV
ncbi:hypothetical protein [Xenorhabdus cabanillasii]|uniref:Uncharacterized protein n=1 Tax=Xenorhabdus cabanillasii JM26 TaxID=1427517 RepID=W1J860_9GAMM|nr:hypothetical protein [Xenorhabdus cabanillasii]PHM75633.1 hemagglutinin [Xenorhabdus cabanillasii JM26]CDL86223.1 hypothetical protein XCR1_2860013 [Xenorhabdus cabanillasii JM26]